MTPHAPSRSLITGAEPDDDGGLLWTAEQLGDPCL
jgi:hypothetical protein